MCVDEGAQWHGNRLSQKPGKIMKGGIFYKWIHFPNHCSPCRPLPTLLPPCSPEIIYLARAQRPHPSPLQFTVPHHSSALCDWTTLLFRRMIHMRCILFIIRMSERTCKEGKVYSTCCFQTVLEIPPPPPDKSIAIYVVMFCERSGCLCVYYGYAGNFLTDLTEFVMVQIVSP